MTQSQTGSSFVAAMVVLLAVAGAARAHVAHRSGAGGWACADWTAAKPNGKIDSATLQWVLGFLSAAIEQGVAEVKFLGPDEIRREARDFCRNAPDSLIEDAARSVYERALVRAHSSLSPLFY